MSPGPYFYFISVSKPNSGTIRNMSMVLGSIIEQVGGECQYKNDNSVCLHFLIMYPDPYFYFMFCLWRVTATFRNILILLGSIKEEVNMEWHMQE